MIIPTKLIKAEWPPDAGLKPGNKRFDELFESIKQNGILEPLTINLKWVAIDGNHRLAAARLLGIEQVDVQIWTGTEMLL